MTYRFPVCAMLSEGSEPCPTLSQAAANLRASTERTNRICEELRQLAAECAKKLMGLQETDER